MIGRTFTVLYHSRDKINDTDGIITICIRPFKSITTVLHSKANIGFIYGSLSAPVGPDFDSRIFLYGGDTLQIVSFPNPRTLPTSQYLRLHDHDVHLIFRYSFFYGPPNAGDWFPYWRFFICRDGATSMFSLGKWNHSQSLWLNHVNDTQSWRTVFHRVPRIADQKKI